MEKLILWRDETSDKGTIGRLTRAGEFVAFTCELPWKNNQRKVSCVPKGVYLTKLFKSPTKNKQVDNQVYLLSDVKDRDMIEIHIGNTMRDVEGCIVVGVERGIIDDLPAVLHSAASMKQLLAELPKSFYLQIAGVCG